MQQQRWTKETIGQLDTGAAEPARTGRRTKAQIQESKREVDRGKQLAKDDEKWDKAYKWIASEDAEYRHWRKAKKGRGSGSSRTPYPSSSWWR